MFLVAHCMHSTKIKPEGSWHATSFRFKWIQYIINIIVHMHVYKCACYLFYILIYIIWYIYITICSRCMYYTHIVYCICAVQVVVSTIASIFLDFWVIFMLFHFCTFALIANCQRQANVEWRHRFLLFFCMYVWMFHFWARLWWKPPKIGLGVTIGLIMEQE